jgi:hypothetical protein
MDPRTKDSKPSLHGRDRKFCHELSTTESKTLAFSYLHFNREWMSN